MDRARPLVFDKSSLLVAMQWKGTSCLLNKSAWAWLGAHVLVWMGQPGGQYFTKTLPTVLWHLQHPIPWYSEGLSCTTTWGDSLIKCSDALCPGKTYRWQVNTSAPYFLQECQCIQQFLVLLWGEEQDYAVHPVTNSVIP